MTYDRFHWAFFNILRRVFGIMATVAGVGGLCSALSVWLGLAKPMAGEDGPGTLFVVGLVALLVGVVTLRRRGYRPDQGDVSWWSGLAGGYDDSRAKRGEPRSWWTGGYRDS
jgi:hypothetical protein